MPRHRRGAKAVLVTTLMTVLSAIPAHGAPGSGDCRPSNDNECTAALSTVTANTIDGTMTGALVGTTAPVIFWGEPDAYLKSQGFGNTAPDPIQRWDAAIDGVNSADLSGPGWYGAAKSRAFLPRSLNELATQFPPDVLVVRFVPDDTHAGQFRLLSIQPVAR